ncbi:amino acid ABC transporter permease [Paenibacillus validus]|uniref:ABC transporter permease subunit n=1 Tax=Paenibacillus validus TaxID=44253 RepID=A0A7X2Z7R6_9BACL|nr:amino acid ABC transporter permease [Paenibacillus validus]MUG69305.1 ABC transporter permease subunit [Paenibacillus validus]
MDNSVISLLFKSIPLLFNGVIQTLWIAVYSLCISTVCGIVFGIFRMSSIRGIQILTRAYVEIFRAVPVLVFMFFFFFGLPILWGIEVPGILAAVLALSFWGIAEIGEIVRGALQSLPKGQTEAGKSIGLSTYQLYRHVLLPQALRRMIPPVMNIYTRMIKSTSLAVLIGAREMIKIGQEIIERTGQSLLIYTCLFIFYFLLCYPISLWSRKLERDWHY